MNITLPKYARLTRSPRAGGEKDLLASFYGDDGDDTITVELARCEGGQIEFSFSRSGLSESCFSKAELAKVLEVSAVLFAAL